VRVRTALSLVCILVAGAAAADASTGPVASLVGRVTAEGRPPIFGTVLLLETQRGREGYPGTQTDAAGRFRLDRVPTGRRTLLVHVLGCPEETLKVDVSSNKMDSILVTLSCAALRPNPHGIESNPEEMLRAGKRCSMHPNVRLMRGVARIQYGLLVGGFERFVTLERDSFPNARETWDGGCGPGFSIADTIGPPQWTEVAYCPKCREGLERHHPPGGWH
jgi:hypothetical protein